MKTAVYSLTFSRGVQEDYILLSMYVAQMEPSCTALTQSINAPKNCQKKFGWEPSVWAYVSGNVNHLHARLW